jgi:formylglycine-generating enzyme required for sulfatase activity
MIFIIDRKNDMGKKMLKISLIITVLLLMLNCSKKSDPVTGNDDKSDPKAGQIRFDGKGIEQVWVPSGSFKMGTNDSMKEYLLSLKPPGFVIGELPSEQPEHVVKITYGYWIDKYEVTNKAFNAFVADSGYLKKVFWSDAGWTWLSKQNISKLPRQCYGNLPDNPAACITWYEAEAYAKWRSAHLPTEAEWEYAARGSMSNIYPWGNEFDSSKCNLIGSKGLKTVGSYPAGASWVGTLDMAGNVMEWVNDWLAPYSAGTVENPTGPATGKVKVEKGGWWSNTMFVARSSYRHFEDPPDYSDAHIGFRAASLDSVYSKK